MTESAEPLDQFLGRAVVLDVASRYVYLGTLVSQARSWLELTDADVHDLRDTTTTRELYVLDAKRHGISANRKRVLVRREEIVSVSAMDDVVE